jgi:transposase
LLHDARAPVYLIVDGHPAHRATATKKFAASTEGRLRLFFLPGYSPELNPDEMSLPQCELRRSSLSCLSGSFFWEVSMGMPLSVQRRRLW